MAPGGAIFGLKCSPFHVLVHRGSKICVCIFPQAKIEHCTRPQCHGQWYCGESSCNALRCDVDPRKLIVRATRKPQGTKIWDLILVGHSEKENVTSHFVAFAYERLQSCFNHMFTCSCVDSHWLPDPVDCLVVRRDASQDCLGGCKATENLLGCDLRSSREH